MYNRYRKGAGNDFSYEPAPRDHVENNRPPLLGGNFLSNLFGGGSKQIGGFLKGLNLDSGDILLILIIIYLFIESDDDEIIIALALLLLLGL